MTALRWMSSDETAFFRRLRLIWGLVAEELNQLDRAWTSMIQRDKRPQPHRTAIPQDAPVAVIMQGPLRLEDAFTLETIRYYRQTMPRATLLVSTWQGEDEATVAKLEAAGARVLLNKPPENPGPSNLNRQIHSTRAGLNVARELGLEYVLKTRTDTRIYSYHVLDYLTGLLKSFPLNVGTAQRERIVVLDSATRLLVPNHPSDLLMFGHIDDLAHYWSSPDSKQTQATPPDSKLLGGLWSEHTPEVFLCEHYLRSIDWPTERTLDSWWRTLAELFIVVDRSSIDHFWPKYGYTLERSGRDEEQVRGTALCSFREWMNLYAFAKRPGLTDAEVQGMKRSEVWKAA